MRALKIPSLVYVALKVILNVNLSEEGLKTLCDGRRVNPSLLVFNLLLRTLDPWTLKKELKYG